MKEFLEYVVKNLVDDPNMVMLEMQEKDSKTVFRVRVGQGDVGKVIGKKGRTAAALRTLLSAVAAKEGKRAILEIED